MQAYALIHTQAHMHTCAHTHTHKYPWYTLVGCFTPLLLGLWVPSTHGLLFLMIAWPLLDLF